MKMQSDRFVIRHFINKLNANALKDVDRDIWRRPDAIYSNVLCRAIRSIGDNPGSIVTVGFSAFVPAGEAGCYICFPCFATLDVDIGASIEW